MVSSTADLRSKFQEAISLGSKAPWINTPPPFKGNYNTIPPIQPANVNPYLNNESFIPAPQQYCQPPMMMPPQYINQPLNQPLNQLLNQPLNQANTVSENTTVSAGKSKIYMYLLAFVILIVLIGLAYWGYRKWCESTKKITEPMRIPASDGERLPFQRGLKQTPIIMDDRASRVSGGNPMTQQLPRMNAEEEKDPNFTSLLAASSAMEAPPS